MSAVDVMAVGAVDDEAADAPEGRGPRRCGLAGGGLTASRAAKREPTSSLRTGPAIIVGVRALFTSVPSVGHLHPMMPLARAFLDRGDDVLWVTGADGCLRLVRAGIAALAAGLDEPTGKGEFDHRFPELRELPPEQVRAEGEATAGEDEPPEWLAGPSPLPLLYLTLGTIFSSDAVLRAAIEGIRELPVRVVLTVGPDGDPASLGAQPDNVHVARYIPQQLLLPRCTAVISHAGSGTFLATLAAGLPQLCLPQAADQFVNAAAAVASGCGIALPPVAVDADGIRDAVQRLLDDPAFRHAATRTGEEIAAMPSAAEVAETLADAYG